MGGNPSVKKRQKEAARQEHQREKAARREQRRAERGTRDVPEDGVDPDLVGISPGPQPIPDEGAS